MVVIMDLPALEKGDTPMHKGMTGTVRILLSDGCGVELDDREGVAEQFYYDESALARVPQFEEAPPIPTREYVGTRFYRGPGGRLTWRGHAFIGANSYRFESRFRSL